MEAKDILRVFTPRGVDDREQPFMEGLEEPVTELIEAPGDFVDA